MSNALHYLVREGISRLPYSTDSYFHDFDICICQLSRRWQPSLSWGKNFELPLRTKNARADFYLQIHQNLFFLGAGQHLSDLGICEIHIFSVSVQNPHNILALPITQKPVNDDFDDFQSNSFPTFLRFQKRSLKKEINIQPKISKYHGKTSICRPKWREDVVVSLESRKFANKITNKHQASCGWRRGDNKDQCIDTDRTMTLRQASYKTTRSKKCEGIHHAQAGRRQLL